MNAAQAAGTFQKPERRHVLRVHQCVFVGARVFASHAGAAAPRKNLQDPRSVRLLEARVFVFVFVRRRVPARADGSEALAASNNAPSVLGGAACAKS